MIAAASASRRIGHGHIGNEHLLLVLAEDSGSAPARVLTAHSLSGERIRAEIIARAGTCQRSRGRFDGDALASIGIDPDISA
ncbi:MAG: Clp protease N-terminal domain-containing protein [Actinomycetota bacterium]|nr:Clp protease N-terminal domain-containing protein [Actinomycetota bacterium]